jgi:hypothetical protein
LAWKSWSCSIGPNWLMAASTGQTKGEAASGQRACAQRAGE